MDTKKVRYIYIQIFLLNYIFSKCTVGLEKKYPYEIVQSATIYDVCRLSLVDLNQTK